MVLPFRVELFFKTDAELRDRLHLLKARGVRDFNLVNKDKKDTLIKWVDIVREVVPNGSVCAHYSLKYNRRGKSKGADNAELCQLVQFLSAIGNKPETEVLLVSGSGAKSKLTSVKALQGLQSETSTLLPAQLGPRICVAFNPYFQRIEDQKLEQERLFDKLKSNLVDKLYLQFGTDVCLLRSSLKWLQDLQPKVGRSFSISGSIFLPTARLIAQQKFRPWSGVFLSEKFLSGKEEARKVVLEIIAIYDEFNVEVLIEAPGIRSEKDFDLLSTLLLEYKQAQNQSRSKRSRNDDEQHSKDASHGIRKKGRGQVCLNNATNVP